MYKVLLVDLDNTLLDFDKAEDKALENTLTKYGLETSETIKNEFKEINKYYWNQFEKGLISKNELLERRFKDFFSHYLDNFNPKTINEYYLNQLSNSGYKVKNCVKFLNEIKDYVDIYPVTNGVYNTQIKRLKKSGLNKYFKQIFVSEKIGFQKPKKEFFDYVFETLKCKKEDCLLLGDSLTADIIGGINYGIDTCWYNPKNENTDLNITYIVKDLLEVIKYIK